MAPNCKNELKRNKTIKTKNERVPAERRQKFSPNGQILVISMCKSKAKCRRQPSRPGPGTLEPGAYYRNYRTGISGGSLRPAPPPPYPPPLGGGSVPLIPLIFCSNNFFPGHAGPWPAPPPPYPPPGGGPYPLSFALRTLRRTLQAPRSQAA